MTYTSNVNQFTGPSRECILSTSGLHRYDATDHCVACGERRKDAESDRVNAVAYALASAKPESHSDRILRIAREAGYRPTRWELEDNFYVRLWFANPITVPENGSVLFTTGHTKDDVLYILKRWAGPANQPPAKAGLAPLDFVAGRDAVIKRHEPLGLSDLQICVGQSVVFEPLKANTEGAWFVHQKDASHGAYVSASDLPRVHAELSALAGESRNTLAASDALDPPEPEPTPFDEPEPARCSECKVETTRLVAESGLCVYCEHRYTNSVFSEGSGGISEMVDRREVDGRGVAWESPAWSEP